MNQASRLLAVVNPAAGGGACGRHAASALDRLRQAGLEIDVFETKAPGEARTRAREELAAGRRDFIAVGGDGTSFEIVNGLLDAPENLSRAVRPSLGFLPLGTGNSFLRDFSDKGAEYAIEALKQGKRRPCDVIRVTHTTGVLHFINIFSIGFVADVGATRNRNFSGLGEFGYTLSTVLRVAALRSYTFPMQIDGQPEDREPLTFLSFNNSRFTGGKMMMAPDANTRDGLLDIIRVGHLGRIGLLRTFPKIFSGTHVHNPAVRCYQAPGLDLRLAEDIDVMVDGEMIKINPRRLEVVPGALDVRT
jgi:diacylglycerol kinase (ATP)